MRRQHSVFDWRRLDADALTKSPACICDIGRKKNEKIGLTTGGLKGRSKGGVGRKRPGANAADEHDAKWETEERGTTDEAKHQTTSAHEEPLPVPAVHTVSEIGW